jgi:hypothetical protein
VTCGECKHFRRNDGSVYGSCFHEWSITPALLHAEAVICVNFEHKGQPAPTPNGLPRVHDLVLADLEGRLAQGLKTYGVPLQPHNGRDALTDAYAEALDLAMYLRQAIFERDGK